MSTEAPTEGETLSAVELLFLSVDKRIGRIADAAEESTRHIARVADALASIASKLNEVIETVTTDDGDKGGSLRVHEIKPNTLLYSLEARERLEKGLAS